MKRRPYYSVTHLLANFGWIDFDLGCSTILPSCSASSANFPSAQAEPGRGWNSQNQCQPNQGSPGDVLHCILSFYRRCFIHSCRTWQTSSSRRRRSARARGRTWPISLRHHVWGSIPCSRYWPCEIDDDGRENFQWRNRYQKSFPMNPRGKLKSGPITIIYLAPCIVMSLMLFSCVEGIVTRLFHLRLGWF